MDNNKDTTPTIQQTLRMIEDKLAENKENKKPFNLSNLYRVERLHYYDNCYHMNYMPEKYADYLTDYLKK